MSKFCGNCGNQVDDNAVVCGYCGTPFNTTPGFSVMPGGNNTGKKFNIQDADKEKLKKILIPVAGGIAGLVVIIVAIVLIIGNTGKNALVKDFAKDLKSENNEELATYASSICETNEDVDAYNELLVKALLDDFDNKGVGDIKKIKMTGEFKEVSERKIERLKENFEKVNTVDADSIEAIYEYKRCAFKVKGTEKTKSIKLTSIVSSAKFYAIKEDGKWKYFVGDLDSVF